ncbi:MAG: DUF456 domain-containing protein [Planctomycetota bacterium]
MIYVAASIVTLFALLGVLLTALTLPGIWIMLLVAIACQWWQPGLYSWWTLGVVGLLAVAAEVAEFAASAAGAARAGASKTGLVGATVGGMAGAIVGTPAIPIPIVGTIVGGVIGAFLGAAVAEGSFKRRPTDEWRRIAAGAATGRLLSTAIKAGFAIPAAGVLIAAAFVP